MARPPPHRQRRTRLSRTKDNAHGAKPDRPQGHHSRRRQRNALPAGHQGHAQGNADHRRPPRRAICPRRSARGRHRACRLRHEPKQAGHRGSLRRHAGTHRLAGEIRQGRQGGRARPAAAEGRIGQLHPPAGPARPRPCGLVRPRPHRRRALRAPASRHDLLRPARLPCRPDGPLRRGRRQCRRRRAMRAGRGLAIRHRRQGGGRAPRLCRDPHGGKAEGGRRAVQSFPQRPLHPPAGDLRPSRPPAARRRQRDPADRQHAETLARTAVPRPCLRGADL